MPAQIVPTAAPKIESTFKAREVEGFLDLHFYRPIGFRLAQVFARLRFKPSGVSVLAGICGVIAGHLYFYRVPSINIAGMVLHACSNTLDNADGQLARLRNQESRQGRIIDSVADHLAFLSIYLNLTLRYVFQGASPAIWFLALGAGISHALQGAAADYYRSTYLYFTGSARTELHSSSDLHLDYRKLSWKQNSWDKLLLALYSNFTFQQEVLAPHLKKLRENVDAALNGQIPGWLHQRYRDSVGETLRWWQLLMTNTRMLVLFVLLFVGQPVYYFWFELIPLNMVLICLIVRQEKMARSLLCHVERSRDIPMS